jgi:hypothetical protein
MIFNSKLLLPVRSHGEWEVEYSIVIIAIPSPSSDSEGSLRCEVSGIQYEVTNVKIYSLSSRSEWRFIIAGRSI